MNFATMKGLTIPEGVVTQITDASGRVLWALSGGGPIVLQVEKITSDTYAGETTYTGEQFILLDIYPKTNGTVSVTYGGLTKTITDTSGAETPNAQEVFFGTFNGVSDSVTTPASGELTIEGDCYAFACSGYSISSKNQKLYTGITDIVNWGSVDTIPSRAFGQILVGAAKITTVKIPNSVKSIGEGAFSYCEQLISATISNGITSIPTEMFISCIKLASVTIPSSVTSIGDGAFKFCEKLNSVTIPEGVKSIGDLAFFMSYDESGNLYASLFEVVLPSTIQSIGANAFAYSGVSGGYYTYLKKIKFMGTTPPVLKGEVFGLGESITGVDLIIEVPKGCGEAYKAAEGWSAYADKIVEAS